MQEKRISVRTDLLGVDAKISEDGKSWASISAKDISDNGIGFVADKDFAPGSQLKLEGAVSDFIKELDITCDIKVVFAGNTPEGKYLYGCKFLNMEHKQKVALSVFIEMMVTKYPPLLQE